MSIHVWKEDLLQEAKGVLRKVSLRHDWFNGCNSAEVLAAFERINGYHDAILQAVIKEIDIDLRKTENPPPFSFCWIDMGSGGRQERTLWSDQDNGILYKCNEKDQSAVVEFLFKLADKVVKGLQEVGYSRCEGMIMANHPLWLQSVEGWKDHLTRWSQELSLDSIRYLLISYDMRAIYGNLALTHELWSWWCEKGIAARLLNRLVSYSLHETIPLGFFGRIYTKSYGQYTGMFHLKEGAYYPLITMIRVLSFNIGSTPMSSRGRIEKLAQQYSFSPREKCEWEKALAFFLYLRLKNHVHLFSEGKGIHDFIHLDSLSKGELTMLKTQLRFLKQQQKYWLKRFGKEGKQHV